MNDQPTQITRTDIDKFIENLNSGKYDIKLRPCFKCSKEFYPNYDSEKCDECFFAQFPKDQVKEFYRSFFE